MDSVKKDFLDRTQKSIDRLHQLMALVNTLPDGLSGTLWGDYELNLQMPFDPVLFAKVRRTLGKDWRFIGKSLSQEYGIAYRRYRCAHDKTLTLSIALNTMKEGSTCRRVQVGTKEVPVYEVVCS
jgi:hypothetical protein